MARYIRRRARTHTQLRDQLLRQLENEAERLLTQMAKQFTEQLANESQRVLKDALNGLASGEMLNEGRMGNLLATAVNYALSRPRTSRNTRETTRSQASDSQFRLSRAQAAAEAAAGLARGERNF